MNARQKLENAKYFIPLLNSYLKENDNLLYRLRKADEDSDIKSPSLQKLIDQAENAIKRETEEFYDTLSLISSLEDQKHRTVIYMRYIENKTTAEIAINLDLKDERQVYRLFKEANDQLDEIMKDREQAVS